MNFDAKSKTTIAVPHPYQQTESALARDANRRIVRPRLAKQSAPDFQVKRANIVLTWLGYLLRSLIKKNLYSLGEECAQHAQIHLKFIHCKCPTVVSFPASSKSQTLRGFLGEPLRSSGKEGTCQNAKMLNLIIGYMANFTCKRNPAISPVTVCHIRSVPSNCTCFFYSPNCLRLNSGKKFSSK